MTLSKEGAAWCREQNAKEKLKPEQCDILQCDYREIPQSKEVFIPTPHPRATYDRGPC